MCRLRAPTVCLRRKKQKPDSPGRHLAFPQLVNRTDKNRNRSGSHCLRSDLRLETVGRTPSSRKTGGDELHAPLESPTGRAADKDSDPDVAVLTGPNGNSLSLDRSKKIETEWNIFRVTQFRTV